MGLTQKNKGHKAGRQAGIGRRHKFKESKQPSQSVKAGGNALLARTDRMKRAKLTKDERRKEVLTQKRQVREQGPPKVVMLLALVDDVNVSSLQGWLAASAGAGETGADACMGSDGAASTMMCAVHKLRATF
eukprot:CAMPEP_0198218558 /NCGR_PEP_ID=MMETSP1445-20131203/69927_1 /TAXON_ID=36898 /ORGANISM="Pyramimonas sp., Strain CCMP2087" /LENGTH=131 /DNA_ID=CAMNT_0043895641 /DNA_START=202 /DNA_END=594 /DNA_ORIENTATION=+